MAEQSPQPEPQIQQFVDGDDNQIIGSMSGHAKAIGKVEKYVEQNIEHYHEASARLTSLHQLPPDISDFTGRDEEIERLHQSLKPAAEKTAVVISAVAGMAGVGKSALAVHVVHQLAPQFPDAQLYVNLRGADEQPLAATDVLAGWLRSFGWDDATMPPDLEGRIRAYRSGLANKRALILLDNAQDAAQVRPLLPGSATCAV
ncbi:MAG: ATP-binding protein, partial [Cyanobacteria bacterium P01_G01_bin.38]